MMFTKTAIAVVLGGMLISGVANADDTDFRTAFVTKGPYGRFFARTEIGLPYALNAWMTVSETLTRGNSKTKTAGAWISGTYEYWEGSEIAIWCMKPSDDPSSTISYKDSGKLPRQVTASGTISVFWYKSCNIENYTESFTENVEFSVDLTATNESVNYAIGRLLNKDPSFTYLYKWDNRSHSAFVNSGFVTSPAFGTAPVVSGEVGHANDYTVSVRKTTSDNP